MLFIPRKILTQEEGSAAIEYAMVLPVLILFILGTLEYSIIMYNGAVIEGATNYAARLAKTGYNNTSTGGTCASPSQTRAQYINCIVQSRLNTLMAPGNLTVVAKSYSAFNDIGQPEPYTDVNNLGHYVVGDPYTDINGNGQWDADMGVAGLGGPGDIVVYTVSYPWHLMTPLIQKFFGSSGTVTISSSAVVKNEPYPVSGSR